METRDRILEATGKLVKQYGPKKFTVDELAAGLKISKKTIYQQFSSKENLIACYIASAIACNEEGDEAILAAPVDAIKKLRMLVHATHTYPLPVSLLQDIRQYYPEQWEKVEELKHFKFKIFRQVAQQGITEGLFKPEVNWTILNRMIKEMSNMYMDFPFLMEQGMTVGKSIDASLDILFFGIVKEKAKTE
ncbi:MAG: TetR/AcrR family transcriptional regulator [Spirochaetia bacterium]|jgi:AcrR family transcriptional regulator|nr:TetR/AcrR family transcriptional regulator [Spirochaetia bacterium]